MLITTDGRRIRADRRVTYMVADVSPDGRYVFLDELRDGVRQAGPTVTAAEWHRHEGNVWVSCSGGRRTPRHMRANHAGGFWLQGQCGTCGAWQPMRQDRAVWAHKRPAGQRFDDDGVQVVQEVQR